MLAAGASLAAGRLGGTVLQGAADPVAAVGRQVIDAAPGGLRESAIGTVGTADKPLLAAGVVLVVLVLGGAVGLLSRGHWRWAAGISLPHFTGAQLTAGRRVGLADLQPGDLVFFPGHEAMYIGGGQMVHAPHSGDVVRTVPLAGYWQAQFTAAVRVVG